MAGEKLVEDLASLSHLDETVILQTLKDRYTRNHIYTYVGDILIAINPFKDLNLYGKDVSEQYKFVQKKSSHPPHIYALADQAYQCMLGKRGLQPTNLCILISGESGSGKTESTKFLLRHLIELCHGNTQLEQQILQVNPLLEAFGNAQTVMNDNSSRFGKYIQLKFHKGQVLGAKISEYLLEKSRLVKQNAGEENFHVFYYLFNGKTPEDLNSLKLTPGKSYRYLQKGVSKENEARSKLKYAELENALDLVGFKDQEKADMFTILAGILHFGEVVFSADQSEAAMIQEPECMQEISTACELLGIDESEVSDCLTSCISVMRGEYVKRHYTVYQAQDLRDAMAKALYGRLFGWIVNRVNCLVTPKQFAAPSETQEIGILDIFGFENFEQNSFEQACINLANEQLQLFFNQYVFKQEQEEYQKEGINWTEIKFVDNQHLLDMFLEKPIGILSLLDEECFFPTGSDRSFVDKLNSNFSSRSFYTKSKHSGVMFSVHHYAGKVSYDGTNWLEKNRDTFPSGIMQILQASRNQLIKLIFGARITRSGSLAIQTKRISKSQYPENYKSLSEGSKRKVTVSAQFRTSLSILMERMRSATPIFIRCLKPNHKKVADTFDSQYVLAQLLYTGMLETTRIRQNGFAVRATFEEFVNKYKLLIGRSNVSTPVEACQEILNFVGLTGGHIGHTKVFLKNEQVELLLEKMSTLERSAVHIQRVARGFVSRQMVKRLRQKAQSQKAELAAMATHVEKLGESVANQQAELCREDEIKASESHRKSASPPATAPRPEVTPAPCRLSQDRSSPHKTTPPPSPHLPIHASHSIEANYATVVKPVKTDKSSIAENRNRNSKPVRKSGIHSVIDVITNSDSESSEDDFIGQTETDDDYFRSQSKPIHSWFKLTQTKSLVQLNGEMPEWFHGIIPRGKAECLLNEKGTIGGFLLRVSEVRFGYCLSFKSEDRCRHYMVDQLANGKYVIVGESRVHSSLIGMLQFYQKNTISNWTGTLTVPCGQQEEVHDYIELIDENIVSQILTSERMKQPLLNTRSDENGYLKPVYDPDPYSNRRVKKNTNLPTISESTKTKSVSKSPLRRNTPRK